MFDVRQPGTTPPSLFQGKQREVCGMQIAEGQPYFATGGDDGLIDIWNLRTPTCYNTIAAHTACTKVCCKLGLIRCSIHDLYENVVSSRVGLECVPNALILFRITAKYSAIHCLFLKGRRDVANLE